MKDLVRIFYFSRTSSTKSILAFSVWFPSILCLIYQNLIGFVVPVDWANCINLCGSTPEPTPPTPPEPASKSSKAQKEKEKKEKLKQEKLAKEREKVCA